MKMVPCGITTAFSVDSECTPGLRPRMPSSRFRWWPKRPPEPQIAASASPRASIRQASTVGSERTPRSASLAETPLRPARACRSAA